MKKEINKTKDDELTTMIRFIDKSGKLIPVVKDSLKHKELLKNGCKQVNFDF